MAGLSYTWLVTKGFLLISLIIFCNALFESDELQFHRLGTELLINILAQFYFMVVVYCFIQVSRQEINNKRAIKPLNIAKSEYESYLSEKPTKFNNALSFNVLTPHFFLKSGMVEEDESSLDVDESMLQYVATKSRVEVLSEEEAMAEATKARVREPSKKR